MNELRRRDEERPAQSQTDQPGSEREMRPRPIVISGSVNRKVSGVLLVGTLACLCLGAGIARASQPRRQSLQQMNHRYDAVQRHNNGNNGRLTQQDKRWLKQIHQVNLADINVGMLAKHKGHSARVRKIGRALASDHRNLDKAVKQTAQRLNIALPHNVNSTQRHAAMQLSKKSGTRFDRAYLHGQIGGHQKAIEKIQWEISHGESSAIKRLARKALPVLRKHLKMLRGAADTKQSVRGEKPFRI
jgi:putative membrane protein